MVAQIIAFQNSHKSVKFEEGHQIEYDGTKRIALFDTSLHPYFFLRELPIDFQTSSAIGIKVH